ncbi:MAG: acyltransferase [Gammaproteobacteria bacterium]|nr:acyltransferase [Gammaproteobacteria bacterium]
MSRLPRPQAVIRIRSFLKNVQGVATFSLLTLNTLFWFAPLMVFAVIKLLLPIPALRRILTRWIMAIGENWVSCNAFAFSLGNSMQWDVRGLESLARDNWYLVVANHQTWVDIIVLQTVFNRRIPFLKFFIKRELFWFPFMGIAFWAMDMPFMKRYSKSYLAKHPEKKGRDLEATRLACEKFRDTPTSVINFIEGTRFSEAKKAARGSSFEHLLPPRAGGIALALSSMGSMFDSILDVTIVYPQGVSQFWELCCGDLKPVVVDVSRHDVDDWMVTGDYANDREFRSRFHQWLTRFWEAKDRRLATILGENRQS